MWSVTVLVTGLDPGPLHKKDDNVRTQLLVAAG